MTCPIVSAPFIATANGNLVRITEDSQIQMSEAAAALHDGQQVFEGMEAYRRADGGVNIFRP